MNTEFRAVYVFKIVGEPDIHDWIGFFKGHVSGNPDGGPFGLVIDWRYADRPWTEAEAKLGLSELAPTAKHRLYRNVWVVNRIEWLEAHDWIREMIAAANETPEKNFRIIKGDLGGAIEWAGDY